MFKVTPRIVQAAAVERPLLTDELKLYDVPTPSRLLVF